MEELLSLDIGRLVFVIGILLVWLFISLKLKSFSLGSFLFLLFILPFNLTLQIPSLAPEDPYIKGVISNYLIPTVHFLDLGFVLLLISLILEKDIFFKKISFITLGVFVLLLLIHPNVLSLLSSFRILFYPLSLILFFTSIKVKTREISFIVLFNVLFQGIVGILQFIRGASVGLSFLGESMIVKGVHGTSFINLEDNLVLRAYGTFPHPNLLGGFFVFAIFYGFLLNSKIGKLISILASIFTLFTFSRIAILIVFLLWGVYTIINIKGKIFSFVPLVFDRFRDLLMNDDASFNDRLKLMVSSWNIFKDKFVFGIGPGRFIYGLESSIPTTLGGFSLLQPVHNIYLLLLSEYGIFFGGLSSLLIFLLLFVSFVGNGWIVKIGIIAFLIISMNDHYFLTLPQGVFLFSLALSFFILQSKNVSKFLLK